MKRDACSKPQAEAKVKAQMPLKLKRDKSQIVIDNSGDKHHCEQQVIFLCTQTLMYFCAHNSYCIPACAANRDCVATAMYCLECWHCHLLYCCLRRCSSWSGSCRANANGWVLPHLLWFLLVWFGCCCGCCLQLDRRLTLADLPGLCIQNEVGSQGHAAFWHAFT